VNSFLADPSLQPLWQAAPWTAPDRVEASGDVS
jgi:hypothetical protein